MPLTVFVGALPYELDEQAARWLTDLLRTSFAGAESVEGKQAVYLANAIDLVLETGSGEAVELRRARSRRSPRSWATSSSPAIPALSGSTRLAGFFAYCGLRARGG
jgi:hypothetical protein